MPLPVLPTYDVPVLGSLTVCVVLRGSKQGRVKTVLREWTKAPVGRYDVALWRFQLVWDVE